MNLESAYSPIKSELEGVKRELNALVATLDFKTSREMIGQFAKIPGKFLRPALLLLSAKTVSDKPTDEATSGLVRTATGVELIHDASLIHDDILDHDLERRGQSTLNGVWGNKMALLAGDLLYSRAFGLLVSTLSAPLLHRVVRLNETMCGAEIEQARKLNKNLSRSEYFRIIEGKTAAFMSLCCRLGASLAGGNEQQTEALAAFGLNFGLAYQLFDDTADGDLGCNEVDSPSEGRLHASRALSELEGLTPSRARDKLRELVQSLLELNSQDK